MMKSWIFEGLYGMNGWKEDSGSRLWEDRKSFSLGNVFD